MRFFPSSFACVGLVLAGAALGLPVGENHATVSSDSDSSLDMASVEILSLDRDAAHAKFQLRGLPDEPASPLTFDFQLNGQYNTADGPGSTQVTLNNVDLDLTWDYSAEVKQQDTSSSIAILKERRLTLTLENVFGFESDVELSVTGHVTAIPGLIEDNDAQEVLSFLVLAVDGVRITARVGMDVVMRMDSYRTSPPSFPPHLDVVIPIDDYSSGAVDFLDFDFDVNDVDDGLPAYEDIDNIDIQQPDLQDDIQLLLRLEEQAEALQAEIASRKMKISSRLRQGREQVSLHNLLEQCDGLLCAANVIAQRICDKVGIDTEPSLNYVQLNLQQPIASGEKGGIATAEKDIPEASPSVVKTSSSSFALPEPTSYATPRSALMRILAIVAGALGLTALVAFIHARCMSPRTRAERAADREERRNARAYRRAARRAYFRQRMSAIFQSLNCFGSHSSKNDRNEDYEDKRALILQEAFLEQQYQDPSVAEKGQVMEAEIRELRNAHDIVRRLIRRSRRGGSASEYSGMSRDPPPPMVPLPQPDQEEHMAFTPITIRSRASSGTLPSYTSETLPDYSSRPDPSHPPYAVPSLTDDSRSRSSSLSFNSSSGLGSISASHSSDSARGSDAMIFSPVVPASPTSGSRSTPSSSVIATSSRPSRETLRTVATRSDRDCW